MAGNVLQAYNPNARVLSYPYYCVQNAWFQNIHDFVEQKKRLPVLNNPKIEDEVQYKANASMSRWEGLYPNLARASAEYLKGCGVSLPETAISNKTFNLCALYMLETSAVVYQGNSGKDGITAMICTKNMELISSEFQLSPKRLAEFKRYCAETADEVVSGKMKCIAFSKTNDGFTKPYCRTVAVNAKHSMLIALMSVLQYVGLLYSRIRSGNTVRLTYHDRLNQRQEIVTSLNPQIVYKRFGNSVDPSTVGVMNPELPVILLTLPDLQKMTIVDVPITQIIAAKRET